MLLPISIIKPADRACSLLLCLCPSTLGGKLDAHRAVSCSGLLSALLCGRAFCRACLGRLGFGTRVRSFLARRTYYGNVSDLWVLDHLLRTWPAHLPARPPECHLLSMRARRSMPRMQNTLASPPIAAEPGIHHPGHSLVGPVAGNIARCKGRNSQDTVPHPWRWYSLAHRGDDSHYPPPACNVRALDMQPSQAHN